VALLRLRNICLLIGVALLASASWLYIRAVIWQRTHNLQPLVFPILLVPGTLRTPPIRTDFSGDYDIVLDLDKGSGLENPSDPRVICTLGLEPPIPNQCEGIPNLIDISWQILDGEEMISRGNSSDSPWATWSDTVKRMIGRFKGQEGHRYILVLQVNRDASELDASTPKIEVQIPQGLWEDRVLGILIEKEGAGILAIVGTVILVLILPRIFRSSRSSQTS
jgi:hypothetical protein